MVATPGNQGVATARTRLPGHLCILVRCQKGSPRWLMATCTFFRNIVADAAFLGARGVLAAAASAPIAQLVSWASPVYGAAHRGRIPAVSGKDLRTRTYRGHASLHHETMSAVILERSIGLLRGLDAWSGSNCKSRSPRRWIAIFPTQNRAVQ